MDFIIALVALVLGIGGGYFVRKLIAQQSVASDETKAAHLIEETRTKQKELLVEAKDKANAVIEEAKREKEVQMQDVAAQQRRLQQREELFDNGERFVFGFHQKFFL